MSRPCPDRSDQSVWQVASLLAGFDYDTEEDFSEPDDSDLQGIDDD